MTKRPLLLTQGDPHGIGPEIALKAWARRHEDDLAPFALIGDPDVFTRAARALDLAAPLREAAPAEVADLFDRHIPLIQISGVTPEAVNYIMNGGNQPRTQYESGHDSRIVARDMREKFGLAKPRLALAGLNPHAGEGGTIGREDEDVLRPAIETLQAEGIAIVGPLSADTMFHAEARKAYDVALCPTHDQALIPAKTLAFDEGVNVTLGLPFIRTSPDHGTAPDIVGKGLARPTSLIAALKLAARLQP